MRFHHLALSALVCLSLNSFSGNYNGLALAEEAAEESIAPETLAAYTPPDSSESYKFQAEVNKMLDIVVNSLYQKKDVFLRELISNASDALDKIRFNSIEDPSLLDDNEEMEIKIQYDEAEKSITVSDSGIGMSKADLISNLGTVARSGTTNFVKAMSDGKADVSMIGQFGVGFYSAFLVSDRVRVASKSPGDPVQHIWESVNGEADFHVYEDPRGDTLGRGTEITLFLKEDAIDYCGGEKLKELVEYYSEFITHPIKIRTTKTMEVPVEDDEDDEDDLDAKEDENEDDSDVEDEDDDEEEEEKEKKMETVTTYSWDQVNTHKPIWSRDKDSITDEEYKQFYKVVSHDYEEPAKWSHFDAEGNVNFRSILYLPTSQPMDVKTKGWNSEDIKGGLKLYVRKVMISDDFELLPPYLAKFIKGVVESDDMPLNVNREALQESKIIKVIKKKLVRKAIEMMTKFAKEKHVIEEDSEDDSEDDEDIEEMTEEKEIKEQALKEHPYITWYKEFQNGIKMGILEDDSNRMKLVKLLRFKTNKFNDENDWVSIEEYIERMKEWQTDIYFFPGDSIEELKGNDMLEIFEKKDVEVIFFTEPIDEYLSDRMPNYDGKKITAITKANLNFKDEDAKLLSRREKVYRDTYKPLTKFLKDTFATGVSRVSISKRLENSPAIVSSGQYGHTANFEKIIAMQAFQHGGGSPPTERILEINPRHPFCVTLNEMVSPPEDHNEDDAAYLGSPEAEDLAWILYDMATLKSGFDLTNSTNYGARMLRLLQKQLDIDSMDLEEEIDPPIEEDEAPKGDDDLDGLNTEDFNFD